MIPETAMQQRQLAEPLAMTLGRRPLVLHARVVAGAGGGPDKTVLNSPRFLHAYGYDCTCAYLRSPIDKEFLAIRQKAASLAAQMIEVDDRGPFDIAVCNRLLQICRERDVTIWHAHDYKTNLLGLWLRRRWPMHLTTTVHGWVHRTWKTPVYYSIDRLCLPHYDHIVCVSDDLLRQCRRLRVSEARLSLIENAIDVEQYRRTLDVAAAKAQLGIAADDLLIGAVGRLSPEKGFDTLLKAVAQLRQQNVDVRLLIVGEGDDRSRLESLIHQLRLGPSVKLMGYCTEPRDVVQALDVFVLPSYREGLPNALLEAMALETPVVATRVAGVPRLVRHEETGLLVEPGEVDALASAIERMVGDANLRQRTTSEAHAVILDRHDFRQRMRRVAALYDRLLQRQPGEVRAACQVSDCQ